MSSITRPDELRTSNRRAVLRAVRRHCAQSRTALSAITGLSAATLSAISNDLLSEGILLEGPLTNRASQRTVKSKRGRPSVQLMPNPSAALIAAVTLTLNEIGVSLVDYSGSVIFSSTLKLATQQLSHANIVHNVTDCVEQAMRQLPPNTAALAHIEVAFQGVTDVTHGTLLWSPILKHKNIPLKEKLRQHFEVSTSVTNDCSLLVRALNEQMRDELGGTFSALLFSHGIGMSIFHDNRVITGARSSATEFGHMLHQAGGALCRCGKHGCIEAYAADYAIWRRAKGIDPAAPPADQLDISELKLLIKLARKQDGPERQAFVEAGLAMGNGLANLFVLFDTFPVVLVGPLAGAFDLMEDSMRKGIAHGMRDQDPAVVSLLCFHDDQSLIREGCIQAALDRVDKRCFVTQAHDHV